jgi:hypothetical protein
MSVGFAAHQAATLFITEVASPITHPAAGCNIVTGKIIQKIVAPTVIAQSSTINGDIIITHSEDRPKR